MFSKIEEFEARIKSKNGFWGRYYDIVKNTVGILLFTYLLMTVMEVIHLSNEAAVEFFETEGCFFKILFNSVFIILLLCVFTAITRSIAIANTIVSLIIGLVCYALNVVCISFTNFANLFSKVVYFSIFLYRVSFIFSKYLLRKFLVFN